MVKTRKCFKVPELLLLHNWFACGGELPVPTPRCSLPTVLLAGCHIVTSVLETLESYSKPQVIAKKNKARAALNASW
jgi:hypothetical protein